jgi:hypothetical protein
MANQTKRNKILQRRRSYCRNHNSQRTRQHPEDNGPHQTLQYCLFTLSQFHQVSHLTRMSSFLQLSLIRQVETTSPVLHWPEGDHIDASINTTSNKKRRLTEDIKILTPRRCWTSVRILYANLWFSLRPASELITLRRMTDPEGPDR